MAKFEARKAFRYQLLLKIQLVDSIIHLFKIIDGCCMSCRRLARCERFWQNTKAFDHKLPFPSLQNRIRSLIASSRNLDSNGSNAKDVVIVTTNATVTACTIAATAAADLAC